MGFHRAIVAAVVLTILSGCSTFEARKLAPDETVGAGDGIPYVLTRAEPRLTRTLKDGKPAYDFAIAHVPDPAQRYTLRANPSWIADVDFSLSFDDDGTLKTVDAVTTERITPTITAVGTLVSSIIPLLFVEETKKPRIEFAQRLRKQIAAFECPDAEDRNFDPGESIKEQLRNLINEREAEIISWHMIDGSVDPDGTFKSLFFVETPQQKECMNELADKLDPPKKAAAANVPTDGGEDKAKAKEMANFLRGVPLYGLAQRHAYQVAKLQRELQQAMRLAALDRNGDNQVETKRAALAKAVSKEAESAEDDRGKACGRSPRPERGQLGL